MRMLANLHLPAKTCNPQEEEDTKSKSDSKCWSLVLGGGNVMKHHYLLNSRLRVVVTQGRQRLMVGSERLLYQIKALQLLGELNRNVELFFKSGVQFRLFRSHHWWTKSSRWRSKEQPHSSFWVYVMWLQSDFVRHSAPQSSEVSVALGSGSSYHSKKSSCCDPLKTSSQSGTLKEILENQRVFIKSQLFY